MIVFKKRCENRVKISVKDTEKNASYAEIGVSLPIKDLKNEGKTLYGSIEEVLTFGIPSDFIEEFERAIHESYRVSRGYLTVE